MHITMKRSLIWLLFLTVSFTTHAQSYLSLDSCRSLALANNKELLIENKKIEAAHFQRKSAFTKYLPSLSATGTYMRNSKEFSLLSTDQKNLFGGLGTTLTTPIQQAGAIIGQKFPELAPILNGFIGGIEEGINGVGQSVIDAMRTDTRNIYAGAVSLTQPLYMGGKIRAYNKITKYAEELAHQQQQSGMQEVILSTDQAYWQVVSLTNKHKLAKSYANLLQELDDNVQKMIAEGVATKADGLTVRVKLNEAEMTLAKVEDGLSLSRMLLCQLCGLDLSSEIVLADEEMDDLAVAAVNPMFDMTQVYANRPEVRCLEIAQKIHQQKVNVERSEHLPSLALMGNYIISNPSVFNSFENKFKGMWNVGVMLKIPLLNWGGGIYKVKAAKAEACIAQYKLEDAKEKIELQVNQAAFKVNEASKKLTMALKNEEKAEENLRFAELGFKEGVIPTTNVLEAQTAWLSAQSEKIDAQIDVKLTEIYLQKSLGTLN